jgi:[ribosomal protein S5]-alanine N-acetyltransferase
VTDLQETARLSFRPLGTDDIAPMHAAYGDSAAMRFWNAPPSADMAETGMRVAYSITAHPDHHAAWAALRRSDGRFVAMVNYHHRETRNRRLEIGYIVLPEFWRQGYGREAVSALLGHCFGALDVHRAEALVEPGNAGSVRLVERLGFRREGLLVDRLCVAGAFRSPLMFALLAPDWRAGLARAAQAAAVSPSQMA